MAQALSTMSMRCDTFINNNLNISDNYTSLVLNRIHMLRTYQLACIVNTS